MRFFLTMTVLAFVALTSAAQERSVWPQFRGPSGQAIAADAKPLPVHFGPDKNLLWKAPLPPGLSSPVVWGNAIFVTAHNTEGNALETICLDRSTGSVRWRRSAPAKTIERVYKTNSPASATPCTDGERVYVSFGSFGLLCYD